MSSEGCKWSLPVVGIYTLRCIRVVLEVDSGCPHSVQFLKRQESKGSKGKD